MHDPKFYNFPDTTAAARYQMDATPGRHTQMNFGPASFPMHLINATGFCMFADLVGGNALKYMTGFMRAVTGWDRSEDELLKAGERIVNMRHVFNLREGLNPLDYKVHPRIIGRPPLKDGPLAGVTASIEAQVYWGLGSLDWNRVTTVPSKKKLLELGLDDVAEEFWPPDSGPGHH
jgi:aldehyde:ferredoxin oxidoreductase